MQSATEVSRRSGSSVAISFEIVCSTSVPGPADVECLRECRGGSALVPENRGRNSRVVQSRRPRGVGLAPLARREFSRKGRPRKFEIVGGTPRLRIQPDCLLKVALRFLPVAAKQQRPTAVVDGSSFIGCKLQRVIVALVRSCPLSLQVRGDAESVPYAPVGAAPGR